MGEMADEHSDLSYIIEDYYGEDSIYDDFEKDIWTTKKYQKIKLSKMGTDHIKNCINYINNGHSVFGLGDKWLPKLEAELAKRN